ncbi:MAG: YggT family protein [Dehalococcoidia bacterium]|nr:YggT family protein [Dehalococcoidia bacterium]
MNDQVAAIFILFLYVLIGLVVARSIITWFSVRPDNQFARFLFQATEPLIEPIRRFMPRVGMLDLSPMVLIVLLYIMIEVVRQAAEQ